MKARVYQFTLMVSNQEAALKFYTEKVGFEKKTDFTPPSSPRWVTVGPVGQEIEFALYETANADPNGWAKSWKPGSNPPIVLQVENCREAFNELKTRGVEFKQESPQEYAWGISATFSDPDGNLFSMNQLPSVKPWS